MFQTHYAKQRPHKRWDGDIGEKLTVDESILYDAAEENILFTKQQLMRSFMSHIAEKRDYRATAFLKPSQFDATLESLCKKGFLKEIYGTRIAKFLASF